MPPQLGGPPPAPLPCRPRGCWVWQCPHQDGYGTPSDLAAMGASFFPLATSSWAESRCSVTQGVGAGRCQLHHPVFLGCTGSQGWRVPSPSSSVPWVCEVSGVMGPSSVAQRPSGGGGGSQLRRPASLGCVKSPGWWVPAPSLSVPWGRKGSHLRCPVSLGWGVGVRSHLCHSASLGWVGPS